MARKKVEEKEEVIDNKVEELDLEEVKDDLTNYMKEKIDKEVSIAVEKASKKLVRHKNAVIIKRDILIIILLIICLFLGYNLYKNSNINIDVTRGKNNVKENKSEEVKETEVKEETPSLQSLTEKYGYLLKNIVIDEDSNYLKEFYKGNLTDEIKLYFSLNNLDETKIISEDDTVYVDEKDLKNIFVNMFDGEFKPKSFKHGDLNLHYLSSKELFFADGKFEKENSDIVKEIINIEEKENGVLITTVEGLLDDGRLYNIVSGEQVKKYVSKDSLEKYKNLLTNMKYSFNKTDDNYKLVKLEVI
ncbi:MAG: hypothetical protein IKG27_04025 [Bacilli bacterium]|nr:hypothetical protein [Bacilli bacterium]